MKLKKIKIPTNHKNNQKNKNSILQGISVGFKLDYS